MLHVLDVHVVASCNRMARYLDIYASFHNFMCVKFACWTNESRADIQHDVLATSTTSTSKEILLSDGVNSVAINVMASMDLQQGGLVAKVRATPASTVKKSVLAEVYHQHLLR